MPDVHTIVWADAALSVPGNHTLGTQEGAGKVLCRVEGWAGWTGVTNDFANAGTPGALARICGVRAVAHGSAAGHLNANLNDINLLIGPNSMDVPIQGWWSDQPTSTGAWTHFQSVRHYLWTGALHFTDAMDWYFQMDYPAPPYPADAVTSGLFRFVWW